MENTVRELQQRLAEPVTGMLKKLEDPGLRLMQGNSFRCCAKCCDDKTLSHEQLPDCLDNCGRALQAVQRNIETEIQQFQDRFQRCAMSCQDQVRDQLGSSKFNPNDFETQTLLLNCLRKCTDDHIKLVAPMEKRLQDVVKQGQNAKLPY